MTLEVEVFTGPKIRTPNPKRPVNMLHGTDPDPYFIESGPEPVQTREMP